MRLRDLIPYQARLWWAMRDIPRCNCGADAKAPPYHATDCPVYLSWHESQARKKRLPFLP